VAVVRGSPSAERSGTTLTRRFLLVALVLVLGASSGAAQAAADSAKTVPGDSLSRRGGDTASAATKDTSAAQRSGATGNVVPVVTPPPVDSILATACKGASPGKAAPSLLTVVFRPGTPDSDRVAAMKEVSGTLAGMTASGEEYVRLTPESGPLVVAAARLIQVPSVTSVSEKSCP
jgi:hypothetical protein